MYVALMNAVCETIQGGIERKDIKLMKVSDNGSAPVHPCVTTGCLPHQNFNLYGAPELFFQAPYVLVSMETADEDIEGTRINMLVQACACSSTFYEEKLQLPDNKAFEDCYLFLEKIKGIILEQWFFNEYCLDGKFQVGTYNTKELTYPYAFGYISFSLNGPPIQINRRKIYGGIL